MNALHSPLVQHPRPFAIAEFTQGTEAPVHRSRVAALAIFAVAAACSTRDDSESAKTLAQDPALVATLEIREQAHQQPLPEPCGSVAVAAQPVVANKVQAGALARQGYDAEVLGNERDAQLLLRRASELDGTDKSAAYHLGRASEALGDRAGAVRAYCRYIALTTTTESAEARQRLAKLSGSETRLAAGIVSRRLRAGRHASAGTVRRRTRSGSAIADDSPTSTDAVFASQEGADGAERMAAHGDVVASSRRVPTVDQPPTSRTENRGPSRVQSAGIGAVGGAIIGAAAGRSVKSAMIGAAAGGILGTMMGGGFRPMNSRMR